MLCSQHLQKRKSALSPTPCRAISNPLVHSVESCSRCEIDETALIYDDVSWSRLRICAAVVFFVVQLHWSQRFPEHTKRFDSCSTPSWRVGKGHLDFFHKCIYFKKLLLWQVSIRPIKWPLAVPPVFPPFPTPSLPPLIPPVSSWLTLTMYSNSPYLRDHPHSLTLYLTFMV